MSLCANGSIEAPPLQDTGFSAAAMEAAKTSFEASGSTNNRAAPLTYLSSAIGALAKDNPNASKMLVMLCTQVRLKQISKIFVWERPGCKQM